MRVKLHFPPPTSPHRPKNRQNSPPPGLSNLSLQTPHKPLQTSPAAYQTNQCSLQTTSNLFEATMNLQNLFVLTCLQPPESQGELAAERFALKDILCCLRVGFVALFLSSLWGGLPRVFSVHSRKEKYLQAC